MDRPAISVILLSFNHVKYIGQAIESVLGQTFTDFELIIWDDASNDGSWELIQSYSDPRIAIFRSPENTGSFGVTPLMRKMAPGGAISPFITRTTSGKPKSFNGNMHI